MKDKIYDRLSWLLVYVIVILTVVLGYGILTEKVSFNTETIISVGLAFFSIFLSAQFYFKSTEQSNDFYDRSQNYSKDIYSLLSAMEAKFNKSLDMIEKGNDNILNRFDNISLSDFQQGKESIVDLDSKILEIIKENLISGDSQKQKYLDEIVNLNNEKKEILNEISEEMLISFLEKKVSKSEVKKFFYKEKGEWGPGQIHEIVYKLGPINIINTPKDKLQKVLSKYLSNELNNFVSEELKSIYHKMGFYNFEKGIIMDDFIEGIYELAKKYS